MNGIVCLFFYSFQKQFCFLISTFLKIYLFFISIMAEGCGWSKNPSGGGAWRGFRTVSKNFWQNCQATQEGERCSTCTVYSAGRALLTSTEDLFRLWKRYLKDHLNPSGASSMEEIESGDERDDLSIKSIAMGHSFLLQLLQVLGPHSR